MIHYTSTHCNWNSPWLAITEWITALSRQSLCTKRTDKITLYLSHQHSQTLPHRQGQNPVESACEIELKEMVLQEHVSTVIVDAGASARCGMQYESECGTYHILDTPNNKSVGQYMSVHRREASPRQKNEEAAAPHQRPYQRHPCCAWHYKEIS